MSEDKEHKFISYSSSYSLYNPQVQYVLLRISRGPVTEVINFAVWKGSGNFAPKQRQLQQPLQCKLTGMRGNLGIKTNKQNSPKLPNTRVWLHCAANEKVHHAHRRYPFIQLGGERHCESKVSCPRTQHNVPGQGSKPDRSIQSRAH